ncbi:MAG: N-acyl homoserine lactonase family protein [Desulfotomaculales bacterium]
MTYTYKIRPLSVALIGAVKGVVTHLTDPLTPLLAPVLVFYLEGGDKHILVDAGISSPGADGLIHGFPVQGGGEEGIRRALGEIGLTPDDIDVLILTHLHFDHCANAGLFRNARIVVNEIEWRTAFNPVPVYRAVYEPDLFLPLEQMNLVLVGDGYQVAPGVQVVHVPGHTLGQQAVVVDTAKGKMVLCGDLAYSYVNIYPGMTEITDLTGKAIQVTPRPDLPFFPPGLHVNLTDWYESMWKVLALAGRRDMLVPGHDGALVGKVLPED